MKILLNLFLAGVLFSLSCFSQPPATLKGPFPSSAQLKWQQMEYYMFIHFGPNTFTDKEWGHGDEDPAVFNPTQLDAMQWVRTAKKAGMKGIIITAKHHDGFCLWPSKYSTHTVRESKWKNGKGDVLKELSVACKKYGLKFGVYLSPWDRNHPLYGTPGYNKIFAGQLEEVHKNYGDIFEQWFDGANGEGPNGKKQIYDWPLFRSVVYKYHPNAIIFSDIGPGCRWVGNENGFAGLTNWSSITTDGYGIGEQGPPSKLLNEGEENGKYWIPAECDVSIRPGWFYSPSTDNKVKSTDELLNIYFSSVGRNGNLLLNVPVDRRGLIEAPDSIRLMEFRSKLNKIFSSNLALHKKVIIAGSNSKKLSPEFITDGKFNTYLNLSETSGSFIIELGKVQSINHIVLQEYISLGQRVKSFSIEYWDGKMFRELAKQTTIGYKRILSFSTVITDKIRVNILDAKASPAIAEVKVF